MNNNPTTASPVTRSAEVQEALDRMKYTGLTGIEREAFNIITAYIAQLEALPKPQPYFCSKCGELNTMPDADFEKHKTNCHHQPKPQSDEGLREAAQALIDRWETPLWKDVPHTGEFIARLREALSRQAPVPTPSDEEAALQWAKDTITLGDLAVDIAAKSVARLLARQRQGSPPVPTSGAVAAGLSLAVKSLCDLLEPFLEEMNDYWRDETETRNPITAAHADAVKTLAAVGQCVGAVNAARAAISSLSQPPAADGKLLAIKTDLQCAAKVAYAIAKKNQGATVSLDEHEVATIIANHRTGYLLQAAKHCRKEAAAFKKIGSLKKVGGYFNTGRAEGLNQAADICAALAQPASGGGE